MIEIIKLNHAAHYSPICAGWAYDQWHKKNRTPFSLVKADYARRAKGNSLPLTYLALDKNKPVGMVSLKQIDLNTRRDLVPWLSALYVLPEYRNKGLGRTLVKKVITEAWKLHYSSVYLFIDRDNTEKLFKYYKSLGWKYYDISTDVMSCEVKIMKYEITERPINNSSLPFFT